MSTEQPKTTHFGFETVATADKSARVGAVFRSVARHYDIMNDLMSFGLHRLWKDHAVNQLTVKKNDRILDLAGGTGDMAQRIDHLLGDKGCVIVCDINNDMLLRGRDKLLNAGCTRARYVHSDGEALPFADNAFASAMCAFGIRNMTDIRQALAEMHRVVSPGGKIVILEFSAPQSDLMKAAYDAYSFHVLPRIGKYIAKDSDSYRYLAESIRRHPDCDTLKQHMEHTGMHACDYERMCDGIVAIHTGIAT